MPRKPRSDIKIGNLEKKLGLGAGAIKNPDGRDARSDKLLKTLRKEYNRVAAGPPVRTSASVKKAASAAQVTKTAKLIATGTSSKPKAVATKPKPAPKAKEAVATKPKPAPKAKLVSKSSTGAKKSPLTQSKPAAPKKAAPKRAKK